MNAVNPPASDSPWFWACIFASAGLVVLWYFSGQYEQRQLRIERQGQARMRAAEIAAEGEARTEVSTPDDLRLPLRPIFTLLAVLLAFAWAMFWWQRRPADRTMLTTTDKAKLRHQPDSGAT